MRVAIHDMPEFTPVFRNVRRLVAEGGRYVIFSALPQQLEGYG